MSDFSEITGFLKNYDGPPVRLMEVCGTHTASIARNGLRSMLSPKIRLVSGPGCPVCVTDAAYVDALCSLAGKNSFCVASFGDMLRVPGSGGSLLDIKAAGGGVKMLYSPFGLLTLAKAHPDITYVFAAVGFETTAPLYALLLERAAELGIRNIRLLTSIKTMPPILRWLCDRETDIAGFIAPGHVSVVTGPEIFEPLAGRYGVPFAVTGFEPQQILESIYLLLQKQGAPGVYNLYPTAVRNGGNPKALELLARYFEPGDALLRGLGPVPGAGLYLKPEYAGFDAGSRELPIPLSIEKGCRCGEILTGRVEPSGCPLFGRQCRPEAPVGACMVSGEGACRIWFDNQPDERS